MTHAQQDCECGTGGTPYEPQHIAEKMEHLLGWTLINDGTSIVKNWKFETFDQAMEFANNVADIARDMNHHPKLTINYSRVSIELTTHKANGLTEKDFEQAKRIDGLPNEPFLAG